MNFLNGFLMRRLRSQPALKVGNGEGERSSINASPVCNRRFLGTNGKACGERALSCILRGSVLIVSESADIPGSFWIKSGEIIGESGTLDTMLLEESS